jgi:hypothetical protein
MSHELGDQRDRAFDPANDQLVARRHIVTHEGEERRQRILAAGFGRRLGRRASCERTGDAQPHLLADMLRGEVTISAPEKEGQANHYHALFTTTHCCVSAAFVVTMPSCALW